ncbi:MAG: type II toxin-antitoxin system VapC family toxin [Chloroflexota bacterium]|nr:type II toxin-antitoxin system VapC family toxin [Chloroflexota bacterium]
MNVIDSSAWLEYFSDGPNASHFAPAIEDLESLVVPSLVVFEVFKHILLRRGESDALRAIASLHQGLEASLDASIAMSAARISAIEKLPLADSVILATARRFGAQLWTQDSDFEDLEGVKFLPRQD